MTEPNKHLTFRNSTWTVSALALAILFIVIAAVGALRPQHSVPLDAHFPTAPTSADLAALRQAYAGPPHSWPRPRLLAGAEFVEMAPLALREPSDGRERNLARLGAQLFEDPLLSASGHISCQSCHNRRLGWGDALPTSFGHSRTQGRRNAQSLFTVGYKSQFFWDGRAASLEEQALGPLTDGREMANHDIAGLVARVEAIDRYREAFAAVRGHAHIGIDDITTALAAFQRTLERQTRFDRFMEGDNTALTDAEIWGLHLFRTKAGCANCHSGATLSDGRFHNLGLSFFGRRLQDLGRYGVTGNTEDTGRFLTPSLRHVSKTAPYMHNGIFPTLAGLVRFYEGGGGRVRTDRPVSPERAAERAAAAEKSSQLKSFQLTPAERQALVSYLEAL